MKVRELRRDDVRPLVEDLWLPFAREMESVAPRNRLAEDVDLVAAGINYREDRLDDPDAATWVAVDDGELVGHAAASVESSAPVFAAGDRLHLGELYVCEPYRGEGVADELLDRVVAAAAERECDRVTLNVDRGNDRAHAFYEKSGFEPRRTRMALSLSNR
ncbi:GNAT family N-acetyltransferase [Halorubrum sp. BOL3-1]|uniref:GNAT family N-acetyltransferase n=1 Tax=Halorubrum sp. BOL3-1 TaxID=2497325 RepID=UPI001004EFFD|nr:GNAT family N-acetyltransferase [Halorubrum sp. BOL3-1]QAU12714.1 GNAT family N-acetyltransferase [Halorubrum sp. BOL3-1]